MYTKNWRGFRYYCHSTPSSDVIGNKARFMHGGLRINCIVSAAKRDAENVPRLAESSPRDDMQCAKAQDQLARRSACEAGGKRSTCGRLWPAGQLPCMPVVKNNLRRALWQGNLNLAVR